jgi:hypothetical protein
MKTIDEDVIRNKPVSQAYRDNWDRIFGDKVPESSPFGVCQFCDSPLDENGVCLGLLVEKKEIEHVAEENAE